MADMFSDEREILATLRQRGIDAIASNRAFLAIASPTSAADRGTRLRR